MPMPTLTTTPETPLGSALEKKFATAGMLEESSTILVTAVLAGPTRLSQAPIAPAPVVNATPMALTGSSGLPDLTVKTKLAIFVSLN